MTTILVTGAGANIGYGAVRLFKQRPDARVIATDIFENAIGQHWADKFYQVPLTADPSYAQIVEDIIRAEEIDIIVPCIEQDVFYYNNNREEWKELGVSLVLNNADLIALCQDKWVFQDVLEKNCSELAIPSSTHKDFDDLVAHLGLPFLLKPKRGYAGKGQHLIKDKDDFLEVRSLLDDTHFAQCYIRDDTEFTVAFYGDGLGNNCASIQMQRTLSKEGATKTALVVDRTDIKLAIDKICKAFEPLGSTNAQFRLLNGAPVLLEINPRLSSSLSLRASFGFNDCAMLLDHYINHNLPTQPTITQGYGIRYMEDLIVSNRDHI